MLVRAGRDLLSARPPLDLPRLTHPHPHPLLDHADDTTTVARRSARANSSASSNGRAAAGARADPSAGHLDADDDQLSSATAHHLDARTETDWVEVAPANGEAEYWLHSLTGEKVHEPPMEWILAQEAKIDAATATKLPRKIPGTGPSTAPPADAAVARNTRSSRKKPVANVGRTRAGPVAHDADASEEATEPVRLEAKFERAAKEEPAKKKRKALETIEIDVNDRPPALRRVTRARTRKSTTPRLFAFPLCTRRSARGCVRFLPRAVPEPDPPLPPVDPQATAMR